MILTEIKVKGKGEGKKGHAVSRVRTYAGRSHWISSPTP